MIKISGYIITNIEVDNNHIEFVGSINVDWLIGNMGTIILQTTGIYFEQIYEKSYINFDKT